jgi:hypothetical protein
MACGLRPSAQPDETDDLIDLLIENNHHIGARAEHRVDRELLDDLKRVTGKQNLLFEVAGAALEKPDGIVRDVVFPVVGEQTLRDLVKEAKATGPTYRITLRTVIRNSYKGYYRRTVPQILRCLEFRSNNEHHRPILQALELLKRYADSKLQTFPPEEVVPIDDIVRGLWRDAVVEKDDKGRQRINRITYEICVLEALREKLRCKEVWVVSANRYRNPDEDLPADFEAHRTPYYQALRLPLEANRFVADLQAEMCEALETLDAGMPANRLVRISRKRRKNGWIAVTPFDPQPEPPSLTAIKADIAATWPMTSLLDMLKEADLRLNLTDFLKSATAYESLDRSVLRPRLLLCLTGSERMPGFSAWPGSNPARRPRISPMSGADISRSMRCGRPLPLSPTARCAPAIRGSGVTGQQPARLIPSTSEPGTRTSLRNGTSATEDAVS